MLFLFLFDDFGLSVFKVQNTKEQYHVLIEIGYAISAIILLLLNLI